MEENKSNTGRKGKTFPLPPKKEKYRLEKVGQHYLDRVHCYCFRNFRTFLCRFPRLSWRNARCKRT